MGQVPASTAYLIAGGGRMARHFAHYLDLESIPFTTWTRSEGAAALQSKAEMASRVLLLISDDAIEAFHSEHSYLHRRTCVHFSGARSFPRIYGAHPLMTFSERLYDLETYRSIPFVVERGRPPMAELLPGLVNPAFAIDAATKPLYHALCAMAGNFSVLLWEKAFRDFEENLGLPKEALIPYLRQISDNLTLSDPEESVLTGPLKRNDARTIERHLTVLKDDAYADVYRAFVHAYQGGQR